MHALAAASLLAGLLTANTAVSRVEALVARHDLDALTLEVAGLDPDEIPERQRERWATALLTAAREAAAQSDPAKALLFGRRAVELRPSIERYRTLASIASSAGDAHAETEALTGLLRQSPNDAPALARLAAVREAEGQLAAALALWNRIPPHSHEEGLAKAGAERCRKRLDEESKEQAPTQRIEPAPTTQSKTPPVAQAARSPSPEKPAANPKRKAEVHVFAPSSSPMISSTDHVVLVYSDKGGEHQNREYGEKVHEAMERVWAFLCPRLERCPNRPIPVALFTIQEYDAKFGRTVQGRRAGFSNGAIHVSYAEAITPGVEGVLAHEFVHAVIDSHGAAPKWVHEGFATYFAGLFVGTGGGRPDFTGTQACLGINAREAPALGSMDDRFPWWGSYAKSRPGYDYACAVARHLDSTQSGKLGKFLDALARGDKVDDALQSVYALDLAGLDQAVRATLPP